MNARARDVCPQPRGGRARARGQGGASRVSQGATNVRLGAALALLAQGCILAACSGQIASPEWDDTGRDAGVTSPVVSTPIASRPPRGEADAAPPRAVTPSPPPQSTSPEAGAEGEPLPPIQVCDAFTQVLAASCGNGSCHSNPGVAIGDFAVSPERAAAFVDEPSARNPECGFIIDSRNYGESLLLTKVTGLLPSDDCGGVMPIGSFVITEAQVECLASWLQQFQR